MTDIKTASDLDRAFEDVTRLFAETVYAETVRVDPDPEPDVFVNDINVTKANKVLDLIETHPDLHEQEAWATVVDEDGVPINRPDSVRTLDQAKELGLGACNTAGCFAGWTAALDGHTVGTVDDLAGVLIEESLALGMTVEMRQPFWSTDPRDAYLHATGDTLDAENYARKALGLDHYQAETLFAGSNSRADIRRYLSDWTDGAIPRVRPVG